MDNDQVDTQGPQQPDRVSSGEVPQDAHHLRVEPRIEAGITIDDPPPVIRREILVAGIAQPSRVPTGNSITAVAGPLVSEPAVYLGYPRSDLDGLQS